MINKKILVREVAERTSFSQKDVKTVLDALCESIIEHLVGGDVVKISDFFTFIPKTRSARQGTNPRTGEPIMIKETRCVVVRASKNVKNRMNNKQE